RLFGVRSGMPMKLARRLCPESVLIRGDMESYSRHSDVVTQIIAERAPVYEKASIDEHYLDITGMDRFFGCMKWAHELRHTIIKESGLPISFGLSVNKTVSKIATGEAKPNGEKEVSQYNVQPFLDPLSIRKIPMIGPKTYYLLRSMGIETIHSLAAVPGEMMQQVLGDNGMMIWKKAHGVDNTPVKPYSEQKSISTERTFEKDTTDVLFLEQLIVSMTEKLAFQLRKQQKMTSCVTIKIKYSNFDTFSQQLRIPYTQFDHTLLGVAKELFRKLYQRRMLIRLIGVRFSYLVSGTQQLDLFEDTSARVNLYTSMDGIRKRFGASAIYRASGLAARKTIEAMKMVPLQIPEGKLVIKRGFY
ncbi:MAG TPA: DNA polymerase IV, partial [Prolixibacteraceae bacterium]|nr:DNA polymerase IV [Prolixibacteraceae bacterium]